MSASFCINCGDMVAGYEKYCVNCVRKHGVFQDATYWQTHGETEWKNRAAIFEADLKNSKSKDDNVKRNRELERIARHTAKPPVYVPPFLLSAEKRAYMKRFGSRPKK